MSDSDGSSEADDRVCVGAIAGGHGVRGLLKVKSFTEAPEDVAAYGPVVTDDGRRLSLALTGTAKGVLLAKAEGIADRDAADALRGQRLWVSRGALPPADEDEFYHADLIGLRVEREDGTPVGTVQALHDFGAGDLVEVRLEGARRTELLRFDRETVPVVDLAGGRIVVVPPDGLFDPPEDAEEAGGAGEEAS
jgi:16S rRNA processing protein RimM